MPRLWGVTPPNMKIGTGWASLKSYFRTNLEWVCRYGDKRRYEAKIGSFIKDSFGKGEGHGGGISDYPRRLFKKYSGETTSIRGSQ
jgi:hypothetical protein